MNKPCEAREAECVCIRETRHKIHRCDCRGEWSYADDGTMIPRVYPGGDKDLWSTMDRLLGPTGLFR